MIIVAIEPVAKIVDKLRNPIKRLSCAGCRFFGLQPKIDLLFIKNPNHSDTDSSLLRGLI